MKNNKEGNKLTREILESLQFVNEIIEDYSGDEIKWWIRDGISIHEHSWWVKKGKSIYPEGEQEPEITFSFAVYVKGDGSFKSGYKIETDTQLKNLFYSLTSKWI